MVWLAFRRSRPSLAVVLLLLLVAGCNGQTFVDGYPIGERRCSDAETAEWLNVHGRSWCDTFKNFARQSLDMVAPEHAQVVTVDVYNPGYGEILALRSGGSDLVVVLRLADDSVRSFYVGCGMGADNERCFFDPDYAKRRTS